MVIGISGCSGHKRDYNNGLGNGEILDPFTCVCGHSWMTIKWDNGSRWYISFGGHGVNSRNDTIYFKKNDEFYPITYDDRIKVARLVRDKLKQIYSMHREKFENTYSILTASYGDWLDDPSVRLAANEKLNGDEIYQKNYNLVTTLVQFDLKILKLLDYKPQ
jgi:hypothetical protein